MIERMYELLCVWILDTFLDNNPMRWIERE